MCPDFSSFKLSRFLSCFCRCFHFRQCFDWFNAAHGAASYFTRLPVISGCLGLLLMALTLAKHGVHGTDQYHTLLPVCWRHASRSSSSKDADNRTCGALQYNAAVVAAVFKASALWCHYSTSTLPPTLSRTVNITSFCVTQLSADNQLNSLIGITHTRSRAVRESLSHLATFCTFKNVD